MALPQSEGSRRLSLVLPAETFNDLEKAKQEEQSTYTGIIRTALEYWFEHRKAQIMADGYRAMNDENRALMQEFDQIDRENW
ncbi:MAG: hypothetical protein IIA59_10470 [Candidatus Marinimicrobia bacterium]|nr:hypothetical protein [Candidatus Neomarinimicrobiota bacterium]